MDVPLWVWAALLVPIALSLMVMATALAVPVVVSLRAAQPLGTRRG
jgi:hypothetical protein